MKNLNGIHSKLRWTHDGYIPARDVWFANTTEWALMEIRIRFFWLFMEFPLYRWWLNKLNKDTDNE